MSSAVGPPNPARVPPPPGGHPLRIEPSREPPTTTGTLRVVDETSAGGLVVRTRDGRYEAAVIARRNRAGRLEWCLPKGHLEGAETPEQAAVREIAEETGISGEVVRRLGVIDYWFSGEDRRVHKVVHHFLLTAVGGSLTVERDPDREAEEAAWVPISELPARLSYPNERRLAEAAHGVLAAHP
jgi:8-oxo-dGTP pyrophosphatase MutT (NUDIX family)